MAEHYRAHFIIEGPGSRGLPLLEEAAGAVRGWAWEQFGQPGADAPMGQWEGDGGNLRIEGDQLEEAGFFALSWERPTGWLLEFRLATQGEAVEADVEVQGPSGDDLHAGPPSSLFDALLKRFDCRADGRPLSTEAARLKPEDAPSFVRDTVFGRNRRMPLVVVTADRFGRSVMSADYLQARLLGLARVVIYDDETAQAVNKDLETPVLSEAGRPLIRVNNRVHEQMGEGSRQAGWRDYYKWLDAQLGCFAGAVRVYAPGCSKGDPSWKHQYWPMERARNAGSDFWVDLRDACMSRSVLWTGPRMYDTVGQEIRRLEHETLLKQQRQDSETEDLLNEWQDKLTEYEKREVEHQQVKARLESEIIGLREYVNELSLQRRDPDRGPATEATPHGWVDPPEKQENLVDVVRWANSLERLEFFPVAMTSARESRVQGRKRLDNVRRVFEQMSNCAKERTRGELGQRLEDWFASKNIEYAPRESEATMNKFGKQRQFPDKNGRLVEMQEHIKLGKGGAARSLRIHFRWSKDKGKWLVGHVGRHLDIASG